MESLIEEMSILVAKIKSGSATQGEIEAFAAAAAQINERAIVLRYKAYESKVFGTPMEQPVHVESHTHLVAEPVEITAETQIAEENVTTEAAVETGDADISFALFDEPKTEERSAAQPEPEGFDLFSMDDDDDDTQPDFEEAEQPDAEEWPVAEEPQATVSSYEAPAEADAPAAEVHNPEPVIEQPVVEREPEQPSFTAFSDEETPRVEERPVFAQPETQISAPYDEIMPQVQASSTDTIHPLYNRLNSSDDSLASKLMAVRLETLKGAFGFNERMQIVRELFQGNNDAFSDAIDALDQLGSKNEARLKVSAYANQFSWDERSDLVMEFVQKVERRYA